VHTAAIQTFVRSSVLEKIDVSGMRRMWRHSDAAGNTEDGHGAWIQRLAGNCRHIDRQTEIGTPGGRCAVVCCDLMMDEISRRRCVVYTENWCIRHSQSVIAALPASDPPRRFLYLRIAASISVQCLLRLLYTAPDLDNSSFNV